MKLIDQENTEIQNDKILYLLAELNTTLDLYYETISDQEVVSPDQ